MKLNYPISIIIAFSISKATSSVIGIRPQDEVLFQPDQNGKWACLNHPEIVLDISKINDDYCDCPDGSDEPGTNACSNGQFYCQNEGHIPGYIKSSLINDGVCDYDVCCDGTDEWNTPISCPNRCEEIHDKYIKAKETKEQEYQAGVSAVIKFLKEAEASRIELQNQFKTKSYELLQAEQDLTRYLESPEYLSEAVQQEEETKARLVIDQIKLKVSDAFKVFTLGQNNLGELRIILDSLSENFNENLKDNAVKQTVERYKNHLEKYKSQYDAEHANELSFDSKSRKLIKSLKEKNIPNSSKKFNDVLSTVKNEIINYESITERIFDLESILNYLIDNYNPNYNDPNVKRAVNTYQDFAVNKEETEVIADSFITELTDDFMEIYKYVDQIPEEIKITFEEVEDKLPFIDRLRYKLKNLLNGFIGREYNPNPVPIIQGEVKDNANDFVSKLTQKRKDLSKSVDLIKKNLETNYGPDDILRPFNALTIKWHIGEYDYDFNFVGDIHQRGNNQNLKIGSFETVEVNNISESEHELLLSFDHGARCWNGPIRKALIVISCGPDHELLTVTEPEKCEYIFKVKSPIGCKLKPEDKLKHGLQF
ncbi:hypothetical protein WICMUC_004418 [Wickerhamomyces mucosus]|uniref:Glucosidase 2 subunit beta n=1 Tax=Wickerhamomyces mucosus TaxID=1378264 RepID=A0A9P8PIW6_9ASCO|nr:hypothetical protein WICMUC_004418 [Wickerhamomyces mucosus]